MAADSVFLCSSHGALPDCFDESHDADVLSVWDISSRHRYPSRNPPGPPTFPPDTFDFPGSYRAISEGGSPQHQNDVRGSNFYSDEFGSKLVDSSLVLGNGGCASSAPRGRGTCSIFFKTKLCSRFMAGTCPYNTSCNFAHGVEELRKPPAGWEEIVSAQEAERAARGGTNKQIQVVGEAMLFVDSQRIRKAPESCRRFYTKEGCPYGDRCIFVHDDQVSQVWVPRESNAISLEPVMVSSRICHKWETTGHCPYGHTCHFMHTGNADRPTSVSDSGHGVNAAVLPQAQSKGSRAELKWKGLMDKITTIYGDWIEEDEWDLGMMVR